jgi:lysophospholipase L1-like esterase
MDNFKTVRKKHCLILYTFARMKWLKRIAGYFLLLLVCLEIALHFYNPFTARLKNGEIILPVNTRYELDIPPYPGMDTHIVHSKNSLGFRGPELLDSTLKRIIVMGGSTTECFYLNDGKDWPSILGQKLKERYHNIWLNNAGMDGQSSFGHLRMLEQYILKLKPHYIFFMCGLNDMSLDTPSRFDENKGIFRTVYDFLELPSTVRNIIRAGKAREAGLNHRFIHDLYNADTLMMNDSQMMDRLRYELNYLGGYKKRVETIIRICKSKGIKPVFIAQSILFSDDTDLYTNVYLGDLKTGSINGKTRHYILKMYNKITYDICKKDTVPFINLNARLPKDSRFYYDGYHFTNDGAEMAAGMIFDDINNKYILSKRPPLKRKKKNGNHTR